MIRILKIFQSKESIDLKDNYHVVYGYNDFLMTENLGQVKLSSLFDKNYEAEEDLLEYLNYQKIYLFHKEDDVNLWENSKCLFSFILFVSSNNQINNVDGFIEYKTLDAYQSVLVYCTNDYNDGMSKIKHFLNCQENPIVNTYTLIASPINIFNEDENKYKCKSIKTLHFRFKVSKKTFSLEKIKNKFISDLNISDENIEITELLGSHDYEMIIKVDKNEMTDFQILKNIYGENGILSFSVFSNYYIDNCSMKIAGRTDESNIIITNRAEPDNTNNKYDRSWQNIKLVLSNSQKGIINKISSSLEAINKYGYVNIIYECLDEFWKKFLHELTFRKNFEDIDLVLEKIQGLISINDSAQLKLYPQNSYFEDLTYSHVKLLYFYNKLIKNIKFLSDEYEYEFGIIPTVTNAVNIEKTFDENKNDDRLFMVAISIKYFYNPSILIFYIVHEISHYIFNDIRSRDQRYIHIKKALHDLLYARIVDSLIFEKQNSNTKSIEDVIKQKYEILWINTEKSVSLKYGGCEFFLREVIDYCSKIISGIRNSYEQFINDIFNEYEGDNYKIAYGFLRIHSRILKENFSRLENLNNYFGDICKLWSECYSDMIAIKVLGIRLDQYIDFMMKSVNNDKELFCLEYNFIRLYMMIELFKDEEYWNYDKGIPKVDQDIQKRFSWYVQQIEKLGFEVSEEEDSFQLFEHKSLFEECKLFLQHCKNKFDSKLSEKYKSTQALYKKCCEYENANNNYELLKLITSYQLLKNENKDK